MSFFYMGFTLLLVYSFITINTLSVSDDSYATNCSYWINSIHKGGQQSICVARTMLRRDGRRTEGINTVSDVAGDTALKKRKLSNLG